MSVLSRWCIFGLLGFAFLAPCSSAESRVQCPDGEVRIQLNIRDVVVSYDGSISVAVAKLGPFSYEVSLSPVQLQQIATETQRANEFVKALIVAYNGCAISKEDFRDGLFRLYPAFDQTADVFGRVVTKLSQGQGLNQSDRRLLIRVFLTLQKMAESDATNTQRILVAIERKSGIFDLTGAPTDGASGQVTESIQTLPSTNTGGALTLTGELSSLSSLAKDGGGAISPVGSTWPQVTGLNQVLLSATNTGGALTLTGELSSLSSLAKDGGGAISPVGGTWGQVRNLNESVTMLDSALTRSAINPNLSQHEFPSVGYAIDGSRTSQSVMPAALDFGSTRLLQSPDSRPGSVEATGEIK